MNWFAQVLQVTRGCAEPEAAEAAAHARALAKKRDNCCICVEGMNLGVGNIDRRNRRMRITSKLKLSATFGMLILASGISGCSMFSPSNAPVDCDAVKNQEQAGFSEAKIAPHLCLPVAKVGDCHSPTDRV